jgi:hypothetical protein
MDYLKSYSSLAREDIKIFFSVFSGYIPVKDLKLTYSTSSGPGGQNVNRVATKVDLRSATYLHFKGDAVS